MGTGQAPVKAYNRRLCNLIREGKATPSFIVSHELPLDEAPSAYAHFDARHEGWTKVVLKPALVATAAGKRAAGKRKEHAIRPLDGSVACIRLG